MHLQMGESLLLSPLPSLAGPLPPPPADLPSASPARPPFLQRLLTSEGTLGVVTRYVNFGVKLDLELVVTPPLPKV